MAKTPRRSAKAGKVSPPPRNGATPRSREVADPPAPAPAPAPSLDFIEPMLCLPVETLPKGNWLYEIKWDGYRAQGIVERSRSRLLSRNGTSLAADFPDIAKALAKLDCWRAIVDGEIVALDETGRADFQQLQQKKNRTAAVRLVLFDLLHLDGEDLLDEPLEARRTLLQRLVRDAGPPLMYSGELHGGPEALISSAAALRLEGIIAKKRGSRYLPDNRKGSWVKYQTERTEAKHLRYAQIRSLKA
ncbi:hypothetical protein [Roseimicrobium sp. ORNL1]|uniref:ATP-dependent DNA ligase n=1 Tax=Roseimicrobium sp. ORNL1 TaxID=2711231 RepID=UPI0013E176CB|nr:hypothetical protein [Roseimicrobium sp. ORNL1]QIF01699.1 hypothetical protein G5S37_09240 [Roseimicrobium sp. ORNL1]